MQNRPKNELDYYSLKLLRDGIKEVFGNNEISKWIFAQALHETNGCRSTIFKKNKNCFGMKHPSKRFTFSTGVTDGYATYDYILESIEDLKLWLNYHGIYKKNRNCTMSYYVKIIHKYGYYEDLEENYLNGLIYWYEKVI